MSEYPVGMAVGLRVGVGVAVGLRVGVTVGGFPCGLIFVTNPSQPPWLVGWKALAVGKSGEVVTPVT